MVDGGRFGGPFLHVETIMKLVIDKPWHGPRRIYQPGEYAIPGDFSKAIAKCCVIEGCGQIVEAAEMASEPFRDPESPAKPERKKPAPSNKARGPAPGNKSKVD